MVSCIVIDDDQDIVEVFCELLSIIKVNVLATGNNGKEAVALYEKYLPDITFTDLEMPKYDGIYVIENIKDKNPNAKLIVVTGNITNSGTLNSLKIPTILKPFDGGIIKKAIKEVFTTDNDLPATLQIQYKFKKEENSYSCTATYEQYRNLKKLPIIDTCGIVDSKEKNKESDINEMQKALDLAFKNDRSHIRDLSEIVIERD